MNKIIVALLLGFAFLTLHMSSAQDGEADEATVEVEAEAPTEGEVATTEESGEGGEGGELTTGDDDTEQPDANGKRSLTLEDMQLWSSIDLDKNGKLTVQEFDRFVRSPSARAFVNQMKSEKAVKAWADKVGIDVAKAKQAMNMGAMAQVRRNRAVQQNMFRRRQLMQRRAIQQRRLVQARRNNYFANIGKQYYRAAMRGGRRDEL